MAVITNYTNLQTAVGDYLARSDLSTFIPNFIQNAEEKLLRTLRLRFMETALSGTISSGVLALPSDYLELKYAYVNKAPIQWLKRVPPEEVYRDYPVRSGAEIPRVIAREGTNFIFGPYPAAYAIAGIYYAKPTLLRDDGDGSNWFTTDAPDLLLYASLMEAEPFLQNDARLQTWRLLYDDALTRVQVQEKEENYSGGSLAVRLS